MREIRFRWFHPSRTCVIHFGNDISFHDLWIEEVQAMVDQVTFDEMEEGYRLPQPFVGRFTDDNLWFMDYHESRPGTTLTAFMDSTGEDGEVTIWSIGYGGACVTLSEEEAYQLVSRWARFIGAVYMDITGKKSAMQKIDWKHEGF